MEKIYLIGFMACGKTRIGKALAKQLNWDLVDMDAIIEKQYNKTIADIFRDEGEKYFRAAEKKLLEELLPAENVVISTGGGVPVFDDNLQKMKNNGFVVYLSCTEETILKRLTKKREDAKRPLAHTLTSMDKVGELLRSRLPFYSSAHITVVCDDKKPAEIAHEIIEGYTLWKEQRLP